MIDNYKEYKALKYPDKFYMDIMHKISKQTHTDQTIRRIAKDTHTLIKARLQTNTPQRNKQKARNRNKRKARNTPREITKNSK